jgi:hypothetical protein
MWKGYEVCLAGYGYLCASEFELRHTKNHALKPFFFKLFDESPLLIKPIWLGYEPFHSMHRAVLLDKDPEWYGQFGWTEKPAKKIKNGSRMSYPYVWPSKIPKCIEQFRQEAWDAAILDNYRARIVQWAVRKNSQKGAMICKIELTETATGRHASSIEGR